RFSVGGMTGEHTRRSVGKTQSWNAETWHAGDVTSLSLVHRRIFVRAIDELELLFQRHLAKQFVNARIPCHHGDRLRQCSCTRERNEGCGAHEESCDSNS